jgi:hypothetical protein
MARTSAAVSSALAICLLSVGGAAHALTVPNFGGPGVPSPGYPDFWGANVGATLTQNNNGTFTLSVIGSTAACGSSKTFANCNAAIFNFPGASYFVGNETMNITANFSASGIFSSGTYTITGSLPASSNPTIGTAPTGVSWGAQGTETLLTANLTADTIDSTDEALGFREVITGGWADQAQFISGSAESVWLYSLLSGFNMDSGDNTKNAAWNNFLAELKSGHGLKGNSFAAIGSIATVPLPGALWLLGGGLFGLAGLARRRRRASVAC